MSFLEDMKKNNTISNSKGSEYYDTTYDNNLDVFTMLARFSDKDKIIKLFNKALEEDCNLALANLLYILDIRNGKGERRIFKIIFKDLCINYPKQAIKILTFISELGRFVYILEGLDTPVEEIIGKLIKKQIKNDMKSDNPSLIAKWLPSHRTHNKNNLLAKKIIKLLGMTEQEYRKTLAELRSKINIVEKNLTNKDYDKINFATVPTKAMLKYSDSFSKNMNEKFLAYQKLVSENKSKINTEGLFAYEIIKKILVNKKYDHDLYSLMWKNQKNILDGCTNNLLVVADTSGSMLSYGAIPYCNAIGLAIYISERNQGFFKNHFITFSEKPTLQEIKGQTIIEKVHNMREINAWNTDIDKVFELILNVASKNHLSSEELPRQILIISDMEFDKGVHSHTGTNFSGWKETFSEKGYKLPTIIFWNTAGSINGVPVTKFENDVAIVSGFSTNILSNLLTLDKYSPKEMMLEKLAIYLDMLKTSNN